MKRNNQRSAIAVDAETGVYWHGERALQTAEEVNAFIGRQMLRLRTSQSLGSSAVRERSEPKYDFSGLVLQ